MTHDRWLLLIFTIGLAAAQYGLIMLAIKDMRWRSSQGDPTTFSWFLVVVCLPIVGPLLYGTDENSRFYNSFGTVSNWLGDGAIGATSWVKQKLTGLHQRSVTYWDAANHSHDDDAPRR